jgi:hypothetical protein
VQKSQSISSSYYWQQSGIEPSCVFRGTLQAKATMDQETGGVSIGVKENLGLYT